MAITPFGKEARKLRIDRDLSLKQQADLMGVAPTFVSAVEAGRKAIPGDFVSRMALALQLTAEETASLQRSAELSAREHRITLDDNVSMFKRETAMMLARKFSDYTDDDLRAIREAMERRRA